jgi:hypothetical protein
MGWFRDFKEILQHVHWQIHDWQNVYGDETINKCRVVALRSERKTAFGSNYLIVPF